MVLIEDVMEIKFSAAICQTFGEMGRGNVPVASTGVKGLKYMKD
jgi:hypothetical protein